jgi:hypothetical protein
VGGVELSHAVRAAVVGGMDGLDQRERSRAHDEDVAGRVGARVPEGVRGFAWHDHRASRGEFVDVLAGADPQRSLEHIPGLVFWVLVQRRLVERLVSGAALRRPLRQHEPGAGRGQGGSGRPPRSDLWGGRDRASAAISGFLRRLPRDRTTAGRLRPGSPPLWVVCGLPLVVAGPGGVLVLPAPG